MKYKNKYSLPSKHMDNSNARTPNKLQYKMVEGVQDSFDFENRGIAAIKKELIPQSSGPLRSIFINPFSPHFFCLFLPFVFQPVSALLYHGNQVTKLPIFVHT